MDSRLSAYADLIVRVGANVQPGQTVFVSAALDHHPLVRAIAESAYAAGARFVEPNYVDTHVRRSFIEHAAEDDLDVTQPWSLERVKGYEGNALIMIAGDPDPELLADVDQSRVGRARPAQAMNAQMRIQNDRATNWTIAAFPTPGQAAQVFGEPDVERLWQAVATAVRLDEDDPVAAWRAHTERLHARCRQLDEHGFDALRFTGPGTDLLVGIHPDARWSGGGLETIDGIRHVPNLPTEEVFVAPDWRRSEGVVRSTRPLALGGTVVRDLEVRFEGGEAVEV
jgi:aminopeptidase